ncbi:MAG: hypothetical protein AB8G15_04015 [Saprospiraceae bacterium]
MITQILSNNSIQKKKKERGKTIIREDIFSKNVTEFIRSKVNQKEFFLAYYLTGKYSGALKVCREGNTNLCEHLHQEADFFFIDHVRNPITKNFIQAIALPAKAYLAYKHQRYADAIKLSEETLLIDEALEKEELIEIHIHKLQQFQNIGRIYHRRKQFDRWIEISIELLNYQLMLVPPSQYPSMWSFVKLKKCNDLLQKRMIIQVLDEIINFCFFDFSTRVAFQKQIFNQLHFTEKSYLLSDLLQKWIDAKNCFWEVNQEEALQQLSSFLTNEVPGVNLSFLKIDLLIDAFYGCTSEEDQLTIVNTISSYHIPKGIQTTILNALHRST